MGRPAHIQVDIQVRDCERQALESRTFLFSQPLNEGQELAETRQKNVRGAKKPNKIRGLLSKTILETLEILKGGEAKGNVEESTGGHKEGSAGGR
jgi:hypothetical protein